MSLLAIRETTRAAGMARIFTFLALLLLAAAPARADGSLLETMMTGDDSRGWEAVGKLTMSGKGFCTGALIAENLVLTAAHCLFDSETGEAYPVSEIEFLAGWRAGRAAAYRGARRAVAHPDYVESGEDRSNDVALIELDQPIRTSRVQPFATGKRAFLSRKVGVVSYAHDRAEMPSIQHMCHVLGRARGTLVLDCDVDFGSSGAPIFDLSGEVPKIISVVSAKAMAGDVPVSLGTALEGPLADLKAILDGSDGVLNQVRPTVRVMGREDAASTTGAKFVRP